MTTRCPHRTVTRHFGRAHNGPYVRYQCASCYQMVKPAAYVREDAFDEMRLMDWAARLPVRREAK